MSLTRDFQSGLAGRYRGLIILTVVNIVVFLLVNIIDNVHAMRNPLADPNETYLGQWLSLPLNSSDFIHKPWTLFTYMFLHYDFRHILGNMLWLYFFGRLFSDMISSHKLIGTYILGGLAGGLLYLLVGLATAQPVQYGNMILVNREVLLGASGGVLAIVVCVGAYMPDYTVNLFGVLQVKLKWMALIAFALTTLIDISVNFGGKVCHAGGAVFGLFYGLELRRGGGFLDRMMSLFRKRSGTGNTFRPKAKLRVEHRKKFTDEEYNQHRTSVQKRIDEILDKISRSGYESLSKEEKDFLFRWHDKH